MFGFDIPFGEKPSHSLVARRRQLTNDPYGPRAPAASWLPSDWESWDYPVLENIESIRQWLNVSIENRDSQALAPAHLFFKDYDIPDVRDAYRLLRHVQHLMGWKNILEEPKQKYTTTAGGIREVAIELRKVRDFIESNNKKIIKDNEQGPITSTLVGVAPRNNWFLERYEESGSETYHKPKAIQLAWKALSKEERTAICPDFSGDVTRDTVVQGLKRARMACGDKPKKGRPGKAAKRAKHKA
jgi:hypothetical protein